MEKEEGLIKYITSKLKNIYWPYFFALMFAVVVSLVVLNVSMSPKKILGLLEEVFMIQEWGLYSTYCFNPVTWYVSAMMGIYLIYWVIYKLFGKNRFYSVSIIISIWSLLFILLYFDGTIHVHGNIYRNYASLGVLRGLVGMGAGIIARKNKLITKLSFHIRRIVCLVSVFLIFILLIFSKDWILDIFIFPLGIVLIGIIAEKRNFLERKSTLLLSRRIVNLSYMVYLSHITVYKVIKAFSLKVNIFRYSILSLIVGIALEVFSVFIRNIFIKKIIMITEKGKKY